MTSQFRLLALVVIAFISITDAALAAKRVALVVGNGDYHFLQKLNNPRHDAVDIAEVLRVLDFEVDEPALDLGQAEFAAAIDDFIGKSADADVSLFYYAGHGIQVAFRNYLIPVDAQLETEADVASRTVDLSEVIEKFSSGKGARIILLDACNNNPLPGHANGLAPVPLPEGFLLAYAAEFGNVALDGGGRNSPFAKALLSYLPNQGEDLASVLVSVRRDVVADTGGMQIPTDWSTLTDEVVLAPGAKREFPPETSLWQLAGRGPDPTLLQIYVDSYPDGAHVADARAQLANLSPNADARNVGSAESKQIEELLWSLARGQRIRELVELYLARYPEGSHGDEARNLLASLPMPDDPNAAPELRCERLATHPRDATANTRGVPLEVLRQNLGLALSACRAAVQAFPENPHYVALLARVLAAGREKGAPLPEEAVMLYREAADRGDARAMVSLGLLAKSGDTIPQDLKSAIALYERAAERGNSDGAINLAIELVRGQGIEKNVPRAVELLRAASNAGSGLATYNLGVLYDEGMTGTPAEALDLYLRAAEQGETRAYLAAAKLLDEGRGVQRDYERTADLLLKGVASDPGDAFNELLERPEEWAPETIRGVQGRLQAAGYYRGALDAKSGPLFAAALNQWRLLGPPSQS